MNAGMTTRMGGINHCKGIGDFVEEVVAVDKSGNIKTLKKKDLKFGYRNSNLSKYIILRVRLKLQKKDRGKINNAIASFRSYRKSRLDLSKPSAG